jgi:iron complex outermembrane receptor protein
MNLKAKTTYLSLAVAAATGLSAPPAVMAAEGGLEEILVTARKREESMQDVGIAVSALSQSEIERAFARDISDLASVSPNLIIDDTAQGPGGVAAIFIRGIGVADVEKNFDPAVGVVQDGIFIGANAGSLLRSIDRASVEVLRGPQGTLFGRNTIGGLINVTTTQPTGELGAKVRAGIEDYDTWYADAIINFGITEQIAAKATLGKRDQGEGYYDNVTLRDDAGSNDYQTYGINLLWEPTDNLAFEYTYKKEETDQDTPPLLNTGQERHFFCFGYGYCSPSLDKPITGDRLKIAQVGYRPAGPLADRNNPFVVLTPDQVVQRPMEATFDTDLHSFELRWDINENYRVDYLFGHWESDETILSNWDGTPELLYGTDRPADYEQDSHELRLTYDARDRLSFVLGAYLWSSEYSIDLNSYIGFNPDFPGQILDIYQYGSQKTDSWAVFLEADYKLTDRLTLTLGGRYTEDEKESKQFGVVNTITPPYTDHPDDKWDEFTPRVGVTYNLTDDVMLFATYSNGYRSGGFNGRVGVLTDAIEPYDPETVDNYELGIKSEWLENRLRVNANVFYMEYDDKQEELQLPDDNDTGQKTVVTNAASATIQGVELDVQAFLTERLTLRGNLGWLDSEYDDFQYTGVDGNVVDLSDLEFRRAPDWTGSLDATYEWDMFGGTAWVRGAYHYLGEHFVNVTNSPELENDEQHLFDASVNYSINAFTFSLFGRNLTDEDGYIHGYDVAGLWSYAATRPPRTYGFEVVYNFGD